MKDKIKITVLALTLSVFVLSCNNLLKEQQKKEYDITVPSEFEKYKQYIDDARFKIYLKMGMQNVAVKDAIHHRDSMLLGEMDLTHVSCRKLTVPMNTGLLVEFGFSYNDSVIFYNNSPSFVSGVFYRDMNIHDWFFGYGELNVIDYHRSSQIDTPGVLKYIAKGGDLNSWFKKRIEDSLLRKK